MLRPKVLRAEPGVMRPLDVLRGVYSATGPLSAYDRVLLSVLVLRADNATAIAEVSLAELGARSGLSRSTVIRSLDWLEAGLKFFTREKIRRGDGMNEINRYKLRLATIARLTTGVREEGRPARRAGEQVTLFDGEGSAALPSGAANDPAGAPPPADVATEGGGSVRQTLPVVSAGNLGSVHGTPSLPAPLPSSLPVCAEPARPAAPDPHPQPGPHTHTDQGPSFGSDNGGGGSPASGDLAAVILEELQAHRHLAPLATRHDALALAEAAHTARKPAGAVRAALRQLAAKIAGNIARASRRVAIGFVINAHVHEPAPPQASPASIDGAPLSPARSAGLLAELARRAESERAAADAKRRAELAALVAQGKVPDPSSWGPMPKYRPRPQALPPELAALSARADEVDGADETRLRKRSSEALSSSLFLRPAVPESTGGAERSTADNVNGNPDYALSSAERERAQEG